MHERQRGMDMTRFLSFGTVDLQSFCSHNSWLFAFGFSVSVERFDTINCRTPRSKFASLEGMDLGHVGEGVSATLSCKPSDLPFQVTDPHLATAINSPPVWGSPYSNGSQEFAKVELGKKLMGDFYEMPDEFHPCYWTGNDNDGDSPSLQKKKQLQESRDWFDSGGVVILHASTLLRMVRSTIFASSPALAGPSALGEWQSDSCSPEKWTKFFHSSQLQQVFLELVECLMLKSGPWNCTIGIKWLDC